MSWVLFLQIVLLGLFFSIAIAFIIDEIKK